MLVFWTSTQSSSSSTTTTTTPSPYPYHKLSILSLHSNYYESTGTFTAQSKKNMADSSTSMSSTVLPLANRPQVYGFIWCSGIFCILVAIWTGLRIYSRKVRQMPLGIEDLLYHISVVSVQIRLFCLLCAPGLLSLSLNIDRLADVCILIDYILRVYCVFVHGNSSWWNWISYEPAEQVSHRPIDPGTCRPCCPGISGGDDKSTNLLSPFQSFLVIQSLYGLSMCTIKWSMLFMLKRIFAVRYFKVPYPPLLPLTCVLPPKLIPVLAHKTDNHLDHHSPPSRLAHHDHPNRLPHLPPRCQKLGPHCPRRLRQPHRRLHRRLYRQCPRRLPHAHPPSTHDFPSTSQVRV